MFIIVVVVVAAAFVAVLVAGIAPAQTQHTASRYRNVNQFYNVWCFEQQQQRPHRQRVRTGLFMADTPRIHCENKYEKVESLNRHSTQFTDSNVLFLSFCKVTATARARLHECVPVRVC